MNYNSIFYKHDRLHKVHEFWDGSWNLKGNVFCDWLVLIDKLFLSCKSMYEPIKEGSSYDLNTSRLILHEEFTCQ